MKSNVKTNSSYLCQKHDIMIYSRMISGNFKASLLIICHFKTLIFENFKLNPLQLYGTCKGEINQGKCLYFTRPVGQNMAIIDVMLP